LLGDGLEEGGQSHYQLGGRGGQLYRQVSYALNNQQNRQTSIWQQGLQIIRIIGTVLELRKYQLSVEIHFNVHLFMPYYLKLLYIFKVL
jgi:hypothetical protein